MRAEAPLLVYYDASCPLCAAEMHALKCEDANRVIELRDCSAPGFADSGALRDGIDRAAMMAALHVRDATGAWYRGIDAFEVLYRAVGIERLARLWGSARLRPLWRWLYPLIARHRLLLSRLGLSTAFGWVIRRQAMRAVHCTRTCGDD